MKMREIFFIMTLLIFIESVIPAQDTEKALSKDYKNMHCSLSQEDGSSMLGMDAKPLGPPVIWGDAVIVPAFRLRFVNDKTGEATKAEEVSILYGWKWLEYPSPEHLLGAWEGAEDTIECDKIEAAELSFPQFEVKPRGWYKGKYAKKPSFDGITIVFRIDGCEATADIKPNEAKNLAGKTIVIQFESNVYGCYTTKISYERQAKPKQ
jgi:hypothetical protein